MPCSGSQTVTAASLTRSTPRCTTSFLYKLKVRSADSFPSLIGWQGTMVVEENENVAESQQQTKRTAKESQALFPEGDIPILAEKGVGEMLRNYKIDKVPEYYIKPESMRQHSDSVVDSDAAQNCLPIIDLTSPREELVVAIGRACQWGYFQIINHGTDPNLLNKIARQSEEFFSLPIEEKIRCTTSKKVTGPIHFGGGSNGDWRDVLKVACAPASVVAMDYWPVEPEGYRETIKQYVTAQQALMMRLLDIISESLGLERDYIADECRDPRLLLAINHYPPSPNPSLTMGIREHSDPNTLTIVLQDQVSGLQMYKDGLWFDVKPLENALVVNAGDHLQVLSNGIYPSCLHRVVNNKTQARTSIALFLSPALTAHIKPAPALVDPEHPPKYVEFTYSEFVNKFYSHGGPNKKVILSQFDRRHSELPQLRS